MTNFTAKHLLQFSKAVLTRNAPVYCQFVVTNRCKHQCVYCNAPEKRKNEPELNLDQIRKVAEKVSAMGSVFVILTGGEPFLRDDLEEIVKIFAATGMKVRIQTMGWNAPESRIKAVFDSGLSDFSLSLDSLDPELQDRLCRASGVLKNELAVLSRILRHSSSKMMTGVNIVVNKANLDQIPNLVAFCSHIGLVASLIPFHSQPSGDASFIIRAARHEKQNGLSLAFRPEDEPRLRRSFQQLRLMQANGHILHNSSWFLKNCPDFLLGRKPVWICDSPRLYFSISSSGKFLPCVDRSSDISILEDDFLGRYASGDIAKRLDKNVRSCEGCFYACYPEFSRMVRSPGMVFERLRQVRQVKKGSNKLFTEEELWRLAKWFKDQDPEKLSGSPNSLHPKI